MMQIENTQVYGWEAAIRGMRNPMNSWAKSDSSFEDCVPDYAMDTAIAFPCLQLGENDIALMQKLTAAGSDHRKFLRMINVTCDITAPLYWWKEFDTYKVGTVSNSCSTMHKLHSSELTLKDFSYEHLTPDSRKLLLDIIESLNQNRAAYIETQEKSCWWQMIQLLPSSYNQRRTVQLNYEVLRNMYFARKDHKLDEWRMFCAWITTLPCTELIGGNAIET